MSLVRVKSGECPPPHHTTPRCLSKNEQRRRESAPSRGSRRPQIARWRSSMRKASLTTIPESEKPEEERASSFPVILSPSLRLSKVQYKILTLQPTTNRRARDDRQPSQILVFEESAIIIWNSLPLHTRNATTIDTFKSALKTHLFSLQESD